MSGLIDVRDLSIEFETRGMKVPALDRVSFRIDPGATVALVGESGSGKSVTAQAIMRILPRTAASSGWDLGGDGATVGLRIPAHRLAAALLAATGPLATSSANRSGEPPATTCDDVRRTFGDLVAAYLCADDPLDGAASTVLDLAHGAPALVRRGDLAPEEIERFLPRGEPLLDSPPSP